VWRNRVTVTRLFSSSRPRGAPSVATLLDMSAPVPPGAGVQASDPARLTDGQVIPRQVVDMPTGGSFTVDLERAPQTLRDLTTARDELRDLMREARRLGRVDPGSNDDVSRGAAILLGAVADGGDGSLIRALDAGAQRLDDLIAAIKAEMRSYGDAEQGAQTDFDEARS
jgi:hypothetical protein